MNNQLRPVPECRNARYVDGSYLCAAPAHGGDPERMPMCSFGKTLFGTPYVCTEMRVRNEMVRQGRLPSPETPVGTMTKKELQQLIKSTVRGHSSDIEMGKAYADLRNVFDEDNYYDDRW